MQFVNLFVSSEHIKKELLQLKSDIIIMFLLRRSIDK
jgi:hypothetical protein